MARNSCPTRTPKCMPMTVSAKRIRSSILRKHDRTVVNEFREISGAHRGSRMTKLEKEVTTMKRLMCVISMLVLGDSVAWCLEGDAAKKAIQTSAAAQGLNAAESDQAVR